MLRSIPVLITACLAVTAAVLARAELPGEPLTVCTITVNSPDEREAMRRALPPNRYRFVELVERGRGDWLASACKSDVRCDVLLVSGHFDGSSMFFSDRVDANEYLPVAELERVSCSDACPGLFGSLREVYLFGCDTLNPDGNPVRVLGVPQRDVPRRNASLAASLVPENSRDRMRRIFRDVPVIYGFAGSAPLGPAAANVLSRYLDAGGDGEIGTGRTSRRLLGRFSGQGMVVVRGVRDTDPEARQRALVCRFEDERVAPADKLEYVHALLRADPALTLRYLAHIESHLQPLRAASLTSPPAARALSAITADHKAKAHVLATVERVDSLALRVRLLDVAAGVGWLAPPEKRDALTGLFRDKLLNNAIDASDVDLACRLNVQGELDYAGPQLAPLALDSPAAAALLACFGDAAARQRAIAALIGDRPDDVELAKAYLHHRPLTDPGEFRALARAIARMSEPASQAKLLETLVRHGESDDDSIATLLGLYATTPSGEVQRAIAAVLVRADIPQGRGPVLAQTLRAYRLELSGRPDAIDVLLRRLASR